MILISIFTGFLIIAILWGIIFTLEKYIWFKKLNDMLNSLPNYLSTIISGSVLLVGITVALLLTFFPNYILETYYRYTLYHYEIYFYILYCILLIFIFIKLYTSNTNSASFVDQTNNHTIIKHENINLTSQTYDEKLSSVDTLFYRSQNYESSQHYKDAFKFIIKLKNIAPFNAWLIYQQNPDATYLANANYWAEKFNRSIIPKSRPYVIMRAFGPVDFVYDVKDTVGDELPRDIKFDFVANGVVPAEAIDRILLCCTKKNIIVQYDHTLYGRQAGWTSHNRLNKLSQIVLNADHTKEIQFSTLIHELAHLMLGHCGKFLHCECEDRTHLSTNAKEIEAETISWLICDRVGIETDAERYLSTHVKSKEALQDISIHKILTTSDKIENMIKGKLCKKEKVKPKG